jgi:hypothetical protein
MEDSRAAGRVARVTVSKASPVGPRKEARGEHFNKWA